AYPYFYVPYEGALDEKSLNTYIHTLGLSLNRAATLSYGGDVNNFRKCQYVAAIIPVKGIPFYGYHVGYSCFLKIYLFNPDNQTRIVDLMRGGAVMNRSFQPYEAHVPFRLQFCIDFNLYGMGWVEMESALFRNDVPQSYEGEHPKRWTLDNIADENIWAVEKGQSKISNCEIELDTTIDQIINRDRAPERNTHHTLEECFQTPPTQAQVPSLAGLWEDDAIRRRVKGLPSQEPPKTQVREKEVLLWQNHDRALAMVAELVHEVMEQEKADAVPTFDNFEVKEDPEIHPWMTAYEAVDALCPQPSPDGNVGNENTSQELFDEGDSSIIVNEGVISQAVFAFERGADSKVDPEGIRVMDDLEADDGDQDLFRLLDDDFDGLDEDEPQIAMDQWEDFTKSSDTETLGHVPDVIDPPSDKPSDIPSSSGVAPESSPRIPQCDGGGDFEDNDKNSFSDESQLLHTRKRKHQTNDPEARTSFIIVVVVVQQTATISIPSKSRFDRRFSPSCTQAVHGSPKVVSQPVVEESRLLVNDEDDPIVDEDDSLEIFHFDDPLDQQQIQPSDQSPRGRQRERTQNEQESKHRHIELDYPAPASPDRQYFMSTLSEMWSSPSPSPQKLSFFDAPPQPFSPSTVPHDLNLQESTEAVVQAEGRCTEDSVVLNAAESENTVPAKAPSQPAESDTSSVFTSPNRSKRLRRVSWHPSPETVHTYNVEPQSEDDMAILSSVVEETIIEGGSGDEAPNRERFTVSKDTTPEDALKTNAAGRNNDPGHRESTVVAEDSFDGNKSDEIMLPSSLLTSPRWSTKAPKVHAYQFNICAPTASDLVSTLDDYNLPHVVHQKPFYSNAADVPSRPKTFGGKEFRIESHDLPFIKPFVGGHNTILSSDIACKPMMETSNQLQQPKDTYGLGTKFWEPVQPPPTYDEILLWLESEEAEKKRSLFALSTQQQREKISQLEAPTPKNPFGYKNSPTKVAGSAAIEIDHMDLFSLELMCRTRGDLLPDPKQDMILAIFYCWQTEREEFVSNGWAPGYRIGIITHDEALLGEKVGLSALGEHSVVVSQNEKEMIDEAMRLVRHLDPDILVGYEIHNSSWGYLIDRYQALAGADLSKMISRIYYHITPTLTKRALEERNSYNSKHTSGLKIIGRHMFNVWRLIRSEVALTNYGFSNVVFHVLQQRIPTYSHRTLTTWWMDGRALHKSRVIRYYLSMVQYSLQLIEVQELVSRTSEFARVFGVDFFSVISRGSQYKVESLMVRLAKPENYIMISPSREQVGSQRAAECLPMIMEPESAFYEDPVAVLDFQSLYPSVMIAYNYCYSTCLGKLGGGSRLGVTEYRPQKGILTLLKDHIHVAPNNVMYVNQDIRRGLLGRMLSEILETRVMVKKAMKDQPNDKSLLKLLEARQLGLKFIANVTYGYTGASFSGRMPGIEIADSIVHSARETLERAIRFVGENPKWRARVVYGDTDSMFVHLPGRTREEAFEIAYDIAETITKMNPKPVKLKFEKVYHGCFLVTKKRYVGASYEHPDQKEPIFDAKGIETIRRDGVPAVQKIMETCIKTMFRTQDLSQVKAYLIRQWSKILQGRCAVTDFMFGKEVRLGSYSENGVPPPGAIVSARRMELDPRAEPQYKERVPYVVVYGDPGARLTDQVVEPKELLRNPELQLNGLYYITKQIIPSLERILQLAGADVRAWFESMPKVLRAPPLGRLTGAGAMTTTKSKQRQSTKQLQHADASTSSGDQDGGASRHFSTSESSKPSAPGIHPPAFDAVAVAPSESSASGANGPRPKPGTRRRRGGKGFVSLNPRIERFYHSVNCLVCEQRITSPHKLLTKSRSRLSIGGSSNGDGRPGQLPSSASILASLSSILCSDCLDGERGRTTAILTLQGRLRRNERDLRATIDVCSSCCRGPSLGGCGVATHAQKDNNDRSTSSPSSPDFTATGTGLVACESIECPVFWRRRKEQRTLETLQSTVRRCLDKLEDLDRAEQYELFLQAEQDAFNAELRSTNPMEVEEEGERQHLKDIDQEEHHLMETLLLGGDIMSGIDPTEEDDGGTDSDVRVLDW
ncbi:DNA polymerase zeta, partial [Actinomortierella wolfii]